MTAILALWPLIRRFLPIPGILAFTLVFMIQRGEIRHWHKQYDGQVAANAKTVANYRAASAQAQADAYAAKAAQEARQDAITAKVDHDAQIAIDDAQRRADAYIASHRVRLASATNPGGSGQAGLPESANASESGDGPGAVAVMADDIRICTENTIRIKAVNQWAAELAGAR